jgi:hypothetical protein
VRCLASRYIPLENHGRQAVRGSVDGSGKTGRASADDRKLIVRAGRLGKDLPRPRDPLDGRTSMHLLAVDQDGQLGVGRPPPLEKRLGLSRSGLVKLMRLRGASKKVAQSMVLSIESVPDDVDGGTNWAQASLALVATVSAARG